MLFQRTIPEHLTSHTFITSLLRQHVSVYYLLIVLCAPGMITPSLLAVNQYSLKTDWPPFFLSAMGNTDNNLPTDILAALRIRLHSESLGFYDGSEGAVQRDASSPAEKQMSSSQEV